MRKIALATAIALLPCSLLAQQRSIPISSEPAIVEAVPGLTYRSGRELHRTNFATQTPSVTCRTNTASQGVFDVVSNKTFVVYPAGLGADSTLPGIKFSAENPWIIAYDHTYRRWDAPVEIFDVHRRLGAPSDCRNYPQLLIDGAGFLHVIQTFSNSGINIQHFVSAAPRSIQGAWRRSEIPNTQSNGNGGAFIDQQGEMYVLYRASYCGLSTSGDVQAAQAYQPHMYVKSSDLGRTWSAPRLLINPGRPDGCSSAASITPTVSDSQRSSIGVNDLLQDRQTNRLWIDFSMTYDNGVIGNRNIIAFDMYTDSVLSPAAVMTGISDFGAAADLPEYSNCTSCLWSAPPPNRHHTVHLNTYQRTLTEALVIEDTNTRYPGIYYTDFQSTAPAGTSSATEAYYINGWDRVKRAIWNGATWTSVHASGIADPNLDPLLQVAPDGRSNVGVSVVLDAEFRPESGTNLYLKSKWSGVPAPGSYQFPLRAFNMRSGWMSSVRLFEDHPDWEVRGVSNFSLIPGGHPSIRAYLKVPKYPPGFVAVPGGALAIGADYVMGEEPL